MVRIPLVLFLAAATAGAQEISVRAAQDAGMANRIDLRVLVDAEVDFLIQGARIRYDAKGSKAPTNVGSEYAASMPLGPVENLRVRKLDGRGDVVLAEEPSARNNWTLTVRIYDRKGGEDRYHARITWDDVAAPTAPVAPGRSRGRKPAPPPSTVISELSAAADGRGTLVAGGQRRGIDEAQITLSRDKTWIASFPSANNARFRGTWEQADAGAVSLKVTDALGATGATGAGAVWIANGRATHIGMEGTVPGRGAFSVKFDQAGDYRDFVDPNRSKSEAGGDVAVADKGRGQRPTRPTPAGGFGSYQSTEIVAPKPPTRRAAPPRAAPQPSGNRRNRGVRELVVTLDGNGFIEPERFEDDALQQVFVRLREGGDARFEFDGDQTWTVQGRWSQPETGRIAVTIESVNSSAAQGQGSVWLNGNSVERIEMEGTSRRTGAVEIRMFVR